jgi:hypothetical protein
MERINCKLNCFKLVFITVEGVKRGRNAAKKNSEYSEKILKSRYTLKFSSKSSKNPLESSKMQTKNVKS